MMSGSRLVVASQGGMIVEPPQATGADCTVAGGLNYAALGTWAEVVASTSFDMLVTGVSYRTNGGSTSGGYVMELAVGAAGSEVSIGVISVGENIAGSLAALKNYTFPVGIEVAAGSRLSVAIRGSTTNVNLGRPADVKIMGIKKSALVPA